jgi:hypothetical protein
MAKDLESAGGEGELIRQGRPDLFYYLIEPYERTAFAIAGVPEVKSHRIFGRTSTESLYFPI